MTELTDYEINERMEKLKWPAELDIPEFDVVVRGALLRHAGSQKILDAMALVFDTAYTLGRNEKKNGEDDD